MDERLKAIEDTLASISKKLDSYHEHTVTNKTDIAWLKRGMFGNFFSVVGAILYSKMWGPP